MAEDPYKTPRFIEPPPIEREVSHSDEEIRAGFLDKEAQLRTLAIFYCLGSVSLVAMSISAVIQSPSPMIGTRQVLGAVFIATFILIFGATGIGLWKYHKWAKVSAFVLCIPGLFIFPVGTLMCALFLIIVSDPGKSPMFSPAYRKTVRSTPHLKPKSSLRFKIVFGGVLLLCITIVVIFSRLMSGYIR